MGIIILKPKGLIKIENTKQKRPRGYWSRETVNKEIVERIDKGLSIRFAEVKKDDGSLLKAGIRIYGSWKKALAGSVLNYDDFINNRRETRYWNEETVIKEIIERLRKGLSLAPAEMRIDDSGLITHGEKQFGSWSNALIAAGVDYNDWYHHKPNGYWSEEVIKKELLKRMEEGKNLKETEVVKDDMRLQSAIRKNYESWEKALSLVVENADNYVSRKWSESTVKEELLKRKEKQLSLNLKDIEKEDPSLTRHMTKYFGTTHKAYEAIGENPKEYMVLRERRKWSRELILKELQQRKNNDLSMNSTVVLKDDCSLYRNAIKYIGSWSEVLNQLK